VEIDLKDGYGSGSYYAINHFRFMDGSTAGQHYFSPMWTLVAGHHLELAAQSNTQTPFEFRVNGFLTTKHQLSACRQQPIGTHRSPSLDV